MQIYVCFKMHMKRFLLFVGVLLFSWTVYADSLLSGSAISGDGWKGLDLGSKHVITIVGWKPTSTSTADLGMFEGANRSDFMDAVPLYMHVGESSANQMNYAHVNCSRGFRYVRYRKSDLKGEYKIAALEFWGDAGAGDDSQFVQLTNLPTVVIHTKTRSIVISPSSPMTASPSFPIRLRCVCEAMPLRTSPRNLIELSLNTSITYWVLRRMRRNGRSSITTAIKR